MKMMRYFNVESAPLPLVWDPSWTFPDTWFDPSDLSSVFVSREGYTPAYAGSPVGAILDKSKALQEVTVVTLPDTGAFAAGGATPPVASGNAMHLGLPCRSVTFDMANTVGYAGSRAQESATASVGMLYGYYEYALSRNLVEGERIQIYFANGGQMGTVYLDKDTPLGWQKNVPLGSINNNGLAKLFTVFLSSPALSPVTMYVRQIKITEKLGNHAVAPTDAARPTLVRMPKAPARRNLLSYTEDLNNAYWYKVGLTVSLGTDGWWTIDNATATGNAALRNTVVALTPNDTPYTVVIDFLAGTSPEIQCGIIRNVWGNNSDSQATVISGPAKIKSNVGGLYRISDLSATVPSRIKFTRTTRATDGGASLSFNIYPATASAITGSVKVKPFQLEVGSDATPYQPILVERVEPRRNMLTYTEEFSNTAWVKTNNTLGDSIAAPFGTGTAVKVILNSGNFGLGAASPRITGNIGRPMAVGERFTYSAYLKKGEARYGVIGGNNGGGGYATSAVFDLEEGKVVYTYGHITAVRNVEATISSTENGFYRCALSFTNLITSNQVNTFVCTSTTVVNQTISTGDSVSGIYICYPQIDAGSVTTPYQKVTNSFDVTEAGVPDVWYLQGDGIDDVLTTVNKTSWSSAGASIAAAMQTEVNPTGSSETLNANVFGAREHTSIFALGIRPNRSDVGYIGLRSVNTLVGKSFTGSKFDKTKPNVMIGSFSGGELVLHLNGNVDVGSSNTPGVLETTASVSVGPISTLGQQPWKFFGGVMYKRALLDLEVSRLSKHLQEKIGI